MAIEISRLLKKGFRPLAANKFAAISWQGEELRDFWMWNGQLMYGAEGQFIQTVRISDLREAAVRYWRDGWTPLRWEDSLLRRMEESLRGHRGLKAQGVSFPEGHFLERPENIPDEYLTSGLKKLISGGANERESGS